MCQEGGGGEGHLNRSPGFPHKIPYEVKFKLNIDPQDQICAVSGDHDPWFVANAIRYRAESQNHTLTLWCSNTESGRDRRRARMKLSRAGGGVAITHPSREAAALPRLTPPPASPGRGAPSTASRTDEGC